MARLADSARAFQEKCPITSLSDAVSALKCMPPELRAEYSEVEKLVCLLLVSPAASAEAERSFSTLRRLKTWLRSTMTQQRLNSLAVCHVHQEVLDLVNVDGLICRTSRPYHSITPVNQEEGQVNGLGACKDKKEGRFDGKSK